jgi:hypothetical protein
VSHLEEVHKLLAAVLGELAVALARRRVRRGAAVEWARRLDRAAAVLRGDAM